MKQFRVVASTCPSLEEFRDPEKSKKYITSDVKIISADNETEAQHIFGESEYFDTFFNENKLRECSIYSLEEKA